MSSESEVLSLLLSPNAASHFAIPQWVEG